MRMKIRTRLFFGFGALIILLFTIAGIGINRFTALKADMDEIFQNRYERVSVVTSARFGMTEMAKHIANILNQGGSFQIQDELASLNERSAATKGYLDQLSDLAGDSGKEQQLVLTADQAWDRFTGYVSELVQLIEDGKMDEAVKLRAAVGVDYQNSLQDSLARLGEYHEGRMRSALTEINEANSRMQMLTGSLTAASMIAGIAIMLWLIRAITGGLNGILTLIAGIADGSFRKKPIPPPPEHPDEFGRISVAFYEMMNDLRLRTENERELALRLEEENWQSANHARILEQLQNAATLEEAADWFASEVVPLTGGAYGAVYLLQSEPEPVLRLAGAYAFDAEETRRIYEPGEGWVGQCARDRRPLHVPELPSGYVTVGSGTGRTEPVDLLLVPVLHEGELFGVFETAAIRPFVARESALAEKLAGVLGAVLSRIRARRRIEELLLTSQSLTEELQAQSEELQHQSEELLNQQEELRSSNEKLEQQLSIIEEKNSELEESRKVLEQQKRELTESSRYKTEFLANMSHELRTPLNSMLILSQLLAENKEGNFSEKQREYAGTIHSSGSDLLRLIDDILDLSKVEAGRMEIHPDAVVPADLIAGMEQLFRPVAHKNGLAFHTEVRDDVPPVLYTDGGRLQQILKNLLGNAFKFTKQGEVRLTVWYDREPSGSDASAARVCFEVSDTGIGIGEDKLSLIFEPFRQADGTTARRFGGTGLGLSISQELANLLGGSIQAASAPGQGSTFTLTLPAAAEAWPAGLAEAAPALEPPAVPAFPLTASPALAAENPDQFAGKSILLVDDDIRNVFALSSFLEDYGMSVTFAENGREALEQLRKDSGYDLVLMDIMMPEMDGYETMRRIRELPEFDDLPIIALTAKAMREDRARCMEAGASDYLAKPIDTAQLLSLIQVWLYK